MRIINILKKLDSKFQNKEIIFWWMALIMSILAILFEVVYKVMNWDFIFLCLVLMLSSLAMLSFRRRERLYKQYIQQYNLEHTDERRKEIDRIVEEMEKRS